MKNEDQISFSTNKDLQVQKIKRDQNLELRLRRFQFQWKFVMFIALNFYIFSGAIAFAFPQYYYYNRTILLPLNVILIFIWILDIIYEILLIPRLQQNNQQFFSLNSFRKKIKRYVKFGKFYLIDNMIIWQIFVLVLFCIHYIPQYEVGRYFGLIILLKLSSMVSYNNEIYKRLHAKPLARSVYTIGKIIYLMALLTHYLGIFFYVIDQTLIENQYFGSLSQNPATYYQGTSLCFSPIQSLSLVEQYIWAAYYSSSLISTIAYGDIVPKNYFENIYVCFLMIISTLFIALLLEQFMILVRQQKFGEYEFIKKFNCLKELMNQKLVPIHIQNGIRSYLVYLQYQKKLKNQQPVMASLPQKLQKHILYFGYFRLYESTFRFLGLQNNELLFQVGLLLQQVICQAQCIMLNPFINHKSLENDEDLQNKQIEVHNPFLYFIFTGKLQQFTKYDYYSKEFNFFLVDSNKQNHNKAINMYEFITGSYLRYGVKIIQLAKLIKFDRKKFEQFLKKYQKEYKKFKTNKQKVLCEQLNQSNIEGNCFICCKNDHIFKNCPKCHYIVKQNVQNCQKIVDLLKTQKYLNKRLTKIRQNKKSKKILNICHRSAIWEKLKIKNLNFAYDLLLNKDTKQLLNIDVDQKKFYQDSKYDSLGVDLKYSL